MKPLSSLKVLDLTLGNPYPGMMFANYGAEVVKIEPPGTGDPIRKRGAKPGEAEGVYQAYYNREKKSVTLDITNPAGQAALRKLIPGFDFLVVNVAEHVMAARGLDYAALKALNPKLIYGVLTPFGEEGPWKDLPDYDLLVMARTGLLDKTGFPEKPTRIGFPLAYYFGSWHLTAAMMAAYLQAQTTGEGQKVSTSSWQCMASVDDTYAQCLAGMNGLPKRIGNGFPTTNPTDTFRCKNGWFALSIGSDQQWWAFSKAAGRNDWVEDPRYSHDPVRSMEHYFGDLDLQLKDYFSQITIEEADRICREAMVPGGPCNTVRELFCDEQEAVREMLVDVQDPVLGTVKQLGKATKFMRDDADDKTIAPAPRLGADTQDVLTKAGFSAQELEALRTSGAV